MVPDRTRTWVANPERLGDDAAQAAGAPQMAEGGDGEMASGSTPAVFISYASQDAAIAQSVVENLEHRGLRCWVAPRDVKPGTLYADAIVAALNEAQALVLVLSGSSVTSSHVSREVERAAAKHKPIIAFRIDAAPLSRALEYFLSESQWIDAGALGMPAALAQLADAVAADPVAAAKPLKRTGARPKLLIVASLVIGIGVAVAVVLGLHPWSQSRGAAQSGAAIEIPDKSVAVLPFVDMSENKDQEYFSDGLSEELIDMLTKVPELRVPARTSSFYFKGKQATIADIARTLAVAHVLEGSVRKSGNTLRITAQLIRADNGYHVWSESYDRKLDDIFRIQDEIAGAVVTALRVRLLTHSPSAGEEPHTGNLAAYDLYLQGRQSYNQGDAAGYQRAVTVLQASTALDPRYGAAYADLALAQFWLTDDSTLGDLAADTAGFDAALAAAEKAVTLAPGLAASYSARGFLRSAIQFDFAGAQADLDKAVALSPGDANALHRSAILLAVLGKLPAAIAREEQALALDPLSAEICMRLAFFLADDQQLARARPLYEKALIIAPSSDRALFNLGVLELQEHQPERALALFDRTAVAPFRLAGQAKAEYSLGHLDASERALQQFIAKFGKDSAYLVASVYAWRGENDPAFEWLNRAYDMRDGGLPWIKIDPGLLGLRGDPRYKALLRRMNLPE
jgi:TolB-like protein